MFYYDNIKSIKLRLQVKKRVEELNREPSWKSFSCQHIFNAEKLTRWIYGGIILRFAYLYIVFWEWKCTFCCQQQEGNDSAVKNGIIINLAACIFYNHASFTIWNQNSGPTICFICLNHQRLYLWKHWLFLLKRFYTKLFHAWCSSIFCFLLLYLYHQCFYLI